MIGAAGAPEVWNDQATAMAKTLPRFALYHLLSIIAIRAGAGSRLF